VVEEKVSGPSRPVPQPQRKRGFPFGIVLGIGGMAALAGIAVLIFSLGLIKPLAPSQPALTATPTALTPTSLPTYTLPPQDSPTLTLAPTGTPTLAPSATPVPADTATPAATLTATQAPTPLGGASGQIAYSSERDGQTQVWIINSDGSSSTQVTHLPDGACQPDWSPGGKQLVFISPCQGKKDTYPGASLFIINTDGTGLTPLVTLPGGDFEPAWSPDGKQIAFTSLRDYSIPHLYLYNLVDNTVKRLSKAVNRDRQPAWSPDGKLLAYETTTLNQPQIWTMTSGGENAREFSLLSSAYDFSPAWAPDGSVVVFSQGSQRILVARQVGDRSAQQFPVSDRIYPAEAARFSTDGWWLAFDLKKDGNTDIYIMTRNGANLARLTDNPGVDFHPAWRP
jgi:Tol biopolymer transport system component